MLTTEIESPADGLETRPNAAHVWYVPTAEIRISADRL